MTKEDVLDVVERSLRPKRCQQNQDGSTNLASAVIFASTNLIAPRLSKVQMMRFSVKLATQENIMQVEETDTEKEVESKRRKGTSLAA